MTKQTTLILWFCCVAFVLNGQDSLVYSIDQRIERHTFSVSVLPIDGNKYISIEETSEKKPTLIFKVFNDEGKLISTTEHLVPLVNDAKIEISHYHVLRDRLLIFLTNYDRKQSKQYAFCITCTLDGKSISQPILLHSIEQGFKTNFGTVLSPDSATVLAYFEQNVQKRTDRIIGLRALNVDMQLLWERELELPYDNDIVQVNQFKIDNEGAVYLLSGRNPIKNNARVLRPQGGRYVVFYFNNASNKLKEFDISFKDKQVISALGIVNSSNEMIVAGYYSNNYSFSAAGTFLFRIGQRAEKIEAASFMAFPKDFLSDLLRERELEKNPEINDLFLDHILLTREGNVMLIGENYFVSEQLNTDISTGRTIVQNVYHFENIVVSYLEPDGKIIWSEHLAKSQNAISDTDRCGYNVYFLSDKLIFVFNDHPANNELLQKDPLKPIDAWNGSRTGVITYAAMTLDGLVERKTLTTNKQAGGLLTPSLSSDVIRERPILGISQSRDYKFCLVQ